MANKPRKIIMQLQKSDYAQYLSKPELIPDCDVYITDTNCGRAHVRAFEQTYITVPKWAFNRSWEYFIYYLAHEFAHINSKVFDKWEHGAHNQAFYNCFEQLCPENLRHYELDYKVSYGKRLEHKHVYSTIICKDGIQYAKCRYCNDKHILSK